MSVVKMITFGLLALVVITGAIDYVYLTFAGTPVAIPDIPRYAQEYGDAGTPLKYVIMGDSRVVGQGGDYEAGIAVQSAKHLAKDHRVSLYNLGVSGARTHDVLSTQVPQLKAIQPDLVVIIIGANDVTHLTKHAAVRADMRRILDQIHTDAPSAKIVMTDAGAMWSVPRIPHPLRYVAGLSSKALNNDFAQIAAERNVSFAPIGAQTGYAFVHDRSNFAPDKFHPNNKGYGLLAKALYPVLDEVTRK